MDIFLMQILCHEYLSQITVWSIEMIREIFHFPNFKMRLLAKLILCIAVETRGSGRKKVVKNSKYFWIPKWHIVHKNVIHHFKSRREAGGMKIKNFDFIKKQKKPHLNTTYLNLDWFGCTRGCALYMQTQKGYNLVS